MSPLEALRAFVEREGGTLDETTHRWATDGLIGPIAKFERVLPPESQRELTRLFAAYYGEHFEPVVLRNLEFVDARPPLRDRVGEHVELVFGERVLRRLVERLHRLGRGQRGRSGGHRVDDAA